MVSFFSPYAHDFVRVAAAVPRLNVADPVFNGAETLKLIERAHAERVALMVFPELGLSSYAIDDLLQQDALLDAVEEGLRRLVEASRDLFPAFAVGLPPRPVHDLRRGLTERDAVSMVLGQKLSR